MNQSEVAFVAQIVVTGLVLVAFFLSLGAGLSALAKWRSYRALQASYEANRQRGAEFMAKQTAELKAFTSSHPATEYDAFMKSQMAAARAEGFAPRTIGEFDLDNFVGTPPRDTYQAPGEVWIGLTALILATVASIIDVWLT
jgi:hypothetical protein